MEKPKCRTVAEVLAEPVYSNEQKRLMKDAESDDWIVRYVVAGNPNTPVKILNKLAIDENENVRSGVAGNLNTPVEILEMLAKDKNWYVQDVAKRALQQRQEGSDEKA